MAAGEPVRLNVTGIVELQKALRYLEDFEGSSELRSGLRKAAEIVAVEARLRGNTFSFRLSDTIRSGSTSAAAFVKGGKQSLPWYGWADFGSRTPRTGQPRSMGPWAKSGPGPKGGRFIYPAIAFKKADIEDAVGDAVDTAKARVGF